MKKILLIFMGLFFQGCSVFGVRTIELLDYTILEEDGDFDIRSYEPYWVARTVAEGGYENTGQSFRRLFEYISGNNQVQEKISMTGPVIQGEKGDKISMTGPVIQHKDGQKLVMEFVLPAKYNQRKPPEPLNPNVFLVKIAGYKAAAISFSGNLNEDTLNRKSQALMKFVTQKQLKPVGEVFSAGYDPPWTIPFLKRNEVMIKIE